MRHIISFAILVLTICTIAQAQPTVYRPRYLVNSQLIPYAIKLQGDMGITKSYLESETANRDVTANSLFFDSYLLPIVATQRNLIIFGVGYMGEQLKSNIPTLGDINYHSLYANLFAAGSIHKKWFWLTYQSVGLFSDEMFEKTEENMKYFQFTKFGYKWSENFATSAGFLFISNFGKPVIVPLVNVTYSTRKFIVNAELPTKVELEFLATSKLRVVGEAALSAKSFFDKKSDNSLSIADNKGMIGIKYNAFKYTWLYVGITKMFDNKYSWQNPETILGTLKDDLRISFGLAVHID